MIYLSTAIVALCSMVYELQLAQLLASLLGNTVLRYSVTIGLYLAALGIGSLLANRLRQDPPAAYRHFILVELVLSFLGGLSIVSLLLLATWTPAAVLSLLSHSLMVVIGVLSGLELPLLLRQHTVQTDNTQGLLTANYLGAMVGAVAFGLWLLPALGLVLTSLATGMLNVALAAAFILRNDRRWSSLLLRVAGSLAAIFILAAINASKLADYFFTRFIS